MNINASDYDGGQEVKEMMNDVIEKYSKLSVEITKSAL
jgi:type III secretory pathway component EscV